MLFGSHVTGLATKARTCLVSAAEQLSPAATSSSPGLISCSQALPSLHIIMDTNR